MLCAFDCETTGLDTNTGGSEIWQIDFLAIDEVSRQVYSELMLFVRPERGMTLEAQKITEMTPDRFADPKFISKLDAAKAITIWCSQVEQLSTVKIDKIPMLGSNISYDEAMVRGLFRDVGMRYPLGYRKIDINAMAYTISQLETGAIDYSSGGLAAQAKKYSIPFQHHDARQDNFATVNVYFAQLDYLRRMTTPVVNSSGNTGGTGLAGTP